MTNGALIKLSFLLSDGGKRCSQSVPVTVADSIPLFRRTGESDFSKHLTTLVALTIYWKYYKKRIPIPLSYRLQDKLDFLKLATFLEEPLNDVGIPIGTYCHVYMTTDDFEKFISKPIHWFDASSDDDDDYDDMVTCVVVSIVKFPCYRDWKQLFQVFKTNALASEYLCFFDGNGELVDLRDTVEQPLYLVRDCVTIRHLLQPVPRLWNKHILLEKEDSDTIFALLLCFKRYGFRCPVDILTIIFNYCDFYEDWNRIVFNSIATKGANTPIPLVKNDLINSYYMYCFGDNRITLADKIFTFCTVWPEMANFIWKTFNRETMARNLNVSGRKWGNFMKIATIGELLQYFKPKGSKSVPLVDQKEQELLAILDSGPSMRVEYKIREELAKYRRGKRFDPPRVGKVERELFKK